MPKRVLAIEDNQSNMILISRVVEAEGYELLRAEDGNKALELLGAEKPDLILLDINSAISFSDLTNPLGSTPAQIPLAAAVAATQLASS